MVNSSPKLTFLLLLISFGLMALGFWYMTGISTKWFMVSTRNHFLALSRLIWNFFQGMF